MLTRHVKAYSSSSSVG